MAHMKYGGQNYLIGPNIEFDELVEMIDTALKEDDAVAFEINGVDETRSVFFVSRGVPITIHSWDPVDNDGLVQAIRNAGIDPKKYKGPKSNR